MSNSYSSDKDDLLGVSQVAEELNYSPRRIREFLINGTINGNRVEHGKWLITRGEVDRFRNSLPGKAQIESALPRAAEDIQVAMSLEQLKKAIQ